MFDIRVLDEIAEDPDGNYRLGRIQISSYWEEFPCYPVGDVCVDELPVLWRRELNALCNGESIATLIHDPRFAWFVYRDGEVCHVQQKFALDGDFAKIAPRATRTVSGNKVDEWQVQLLSIKQWVTLQDKV